MSTRPLQQSFVKTCANYVPLTPIAFMERAAHVYPDRVAVIYGTEQFTWTQAYERARRLASALGKLGVERGDTVSVMLPNVPAMLAAHFGVPMAGAVLNTLNTRLDAQSIAFMLEHCNARVLFTDREYSRVIQQALEMLPAGCRPRVFDVHDPLGPAGMPLGEVEYEALLEEGDPNYDWKRPTDEWDAISLNYTSGTTGNPKGVVYHHRGAYLNAVCNAMSWNMPQHAVYLWTLPMFHCNGWCFPWTLAAIAGTHVCLRRVEASKVFALIREHEVTHLCGAPIVYGSLINAPSASLYAGHIGVEGLIAGAAPPVAVIEGAGRLGIRLTHVYGLTEVYGPAAICAPQDRWKNLSSEERARLTARQGVRYLMQEACEVLDPETFEPVPWDGLTMGEVCFRGNLVMKGYLGNQDATEEAFVGGWFHTGDLAVVDSDGYLKIKDRSKDIIITGGENVSSIEIEDALHAHPGVLAAAVVAMQDERWGEVPCAFVEPKDGVELAEAELIEHCRLHLARFKLPKSVVIGPLPKTATGKIQKYSLRERVKSSSAIG